MTNHENGDILWGCTTLLALIFLNVPEPTASNRKPVGSVRLSYSGYLACQVLQSFFSLINNPNWTKAHEVSLTTAGFSVCMTGLSLVLGGGQSVSETTKNILIIGTVVCTMLAFVTALADATLSGGNSKLGYGVYVVCTVWFCLCMLVEVLKLKAGTPKMRLALTLATVSACFNGLYPDLFPAENSYFISRLLDSIFYLPLAVWSFKKYDRLVADNKIGTSRLPQPSIEGTQTLVGEVKERAKEEEDEELVFEDV